MAMTKVLMTGAAGYSASQMLPTFRERYDVTLIDVTQKNRQGEEIKELGAVPMPLYQWLRIFYV